VTKIPYSVWRPCFGPLEDWPLAVCDARSLDSSDLVPSDLVSPHYIGEKYDIYRNKDQRWYFLHGMTDTEALLIKNFDSETDGRARSKSRLGKSSCPDGY
jgi:hypothetical protein